MNQTLRPLLLLYPMLVFSGHVAGEASQDTPFRLNETLETPSWFQADGQFRVRYETIDNAFRQQGSGGDQSLSLRSLLKVQARFEAWALLAEGVDSRAELTDAGTPVDNTLVNTAELLQANASWKNAEKSLRFTAGRMTVDVGSRRLVSRNNFRNAINGFTGVDSEWTPTKEERLRAFWIMPVTRLPSDRPSLEANQVQFDSEDPAISLFGIYGEKKGLWGGSQAEVYALGLAESDTEETPTRNRRLITPVGRWYRNAAENELDFEIEAAFQTGVARSTTASTQTRDLDVFAGFTHLEGGYTFEDAMGARLGLMYDYATGDDDPNDGQWNRLDPLYGGRRNDFGPTGIYGAFARSNVSSPGWKFSFKPAKKVEGMIAHRALWLDSAKDQWTATGISDPSGNSGTFLGNQVEGRIVWDVVPENLTLETGMAYLFKGEFARNAPGSPSEGNTAYFYAQTTVKF